MVGNRLSISLFRALLRWNRRPEVLGTRFNLDAGNWGIRHLLPATASATIENAEGVQATIFHCFRTVPATEENISYGFRILKELDKVSNTLIDLHGQANQRSPPEVQSRVMFRIGQIVRHVKTNVRAIVIAWSIDTTTSKQKVEVILDTVDLQNLTGSADRDIAGLYSADDLSLVNDVALHRIINPHMASLVEGYDVSRQRYILAEKSSYWYRPDLAVLAAQDAQRQTAQASLLQTRELSRALDGASASLASMCEHMTTIIQPYEGVLHLREPAHRTRQVAMQLLQSITPSISGCVAELLKTAPVELHQPLRRGGAHRDRHALSAAWSAGKHGLFGDKAVKRQLDNVTRSLAHLLTLYVNLDLLLQWRFQNKGLTFHHGLQLVATHPGAVPVGTPYSPRLVSTPEDETVAKWHAQTTEPAAIFKVGQVVRHKRLGYRGVIDSFTLRKRPGVFVADPGASEESRLEQPLYMVVPDELDTRNPHNGQAVPSWFVYQGDLEPLTEGADRVVPHRLLSTSFNGFDPCLGRFRATSLKQYAFPLHSDSASAEDLLTLLRFAPTFDHGHSLENILTPIFTVHPAAPEAEKLNDLAEGLNDRGCYREALEVARRALALDPTFAEAHFQLACSYLRLGEHGKSIEHASEALVLLPAHMRAGVTLTEALDRNGETVRAIATLRDFLELHRYAHFASGKLQALLDKQKNA